MLAFYIYCQPYLLALTPIVFIARLELTLSLIIMTFIISIVLQNHRLSLPPTISTLLHIYAHLRHDADVAAMRWLSNSASKYWLASSF